MQEKLNELSLAELRALAKELGLKGISSLRKAELAETVSRHLPGAKINEAGDAAAPETMREAEKKPEPAVGKPEKNSGVSKRPKTGAAEAKNRKASAEKKKKTPAVPEAEVTVKKPEEPAVPEAGVTVKKPEESAASESETAGKKPGEAVKKEAGRQQSSDRSQRGRDRRQQPDRRQNQGSRDRRQESGRNERRIRRFGYTETEEGQTAGYENTAAKKEELSGSRENERASIIGMREPDNAPETAVPIAVDISGSIAGNSGPAEEQGEQQDNRTSQREDQDQNRARKSNQNLKRLDSGQEAYGILEVMPEGYGFIRSDNYLPGEEDIYVSPSQIRRFNMKTGDFIAGNIRVKTGTEKYAALLYVQAINDEEPEKAAKRENFEDLTPIFPNERLHLERPGGSVAMRIVDLLSPVGKGQRGMIVSPPKAGKTTLLKEIALATQTNHPDVHIIILLIDERPEEVTDIKESIPGDNVEVIYSTFDEEPEHHKRVAEMVLGRAQRLVEHGRDVMILLDSITRLARAYNLTVAPSGRTLSGGLDPAALHMPKKFFGAARNMREGGSLTIMATALVDTGSRMDDVVFEEFKGTGNMELVLDRKLSERRIFPAIDIIKSGTRRDDLLLTKEEQEAVATIHRGMHGMKQEEAVEEVLRLFTRTRNNADFVRMVKTIRL
ncbi:MAG: transcription termination factor Rho [Lachnospiraceae bacterium]|nr:transcription termination factor Rho [Lachnospiraceae bacterium]